MSHTKRALIVIDVQQDYFPEGGFPLWNAEQTLARTVAAIALAKARDMPVILVQHVVAAEAGTAPFFKAGSHGVNIHPAILAAAPGAPVVTKAFADSFVDTDLEARLQELGVEQLLICGMMTQNCVTHTAISRSAEKYGVAILSDCCTTVSEMIHAIALRAVSTRMTLLTLDEALPDCQPSVSANL